MERDHTSHILCLILLLCGLQLYWGFDRTFEEGLNKEMLSAEEGWKAAREKTLKIRQDHCVQFMAAYSNELKTYYDPTWPMMVYHQCLER